MPEAVHSASWRSRPWDHWERYCGPLLIFLLSGLCEIIRDTPFCISNPPAIFIPVIVFAGFRSGLMPALATAALAWAYTTYFLSGYDTLGLSGDNLHRVLMWGFSMPLTAWMVGELNQKASWALARVKQAEQDKERAKEQARVENALRESEALLRTFVDHATDAFFLHDTYDFGRILDLNRQACESLGYTREELLGNYPRIFDVGLPPENVIRIGKRVAAGETFSFETRYRRKDGSEFPVELRVRPIQHGGKRRSIVLARDITERKQAEKALGESHDLLRAVVEGTPDAIIIKDIESRYRVVNSAGARQLGKSVEEVIGKQDADLFPPERAEAIRERDLHVLATGESETFEETVIAPAGVRTYLATKGPFRDLEGNVIGLVRVSRDVTELKRFEILFRQAQNASPPDSEVGGTGGEPDLPIARFQP